MVMNMNIMKEQEDIFEISYDLPDTFPNKPTDEEKFIIPSTIQTFECSKTQECSICHGYHHCYYCEGIGTVGCPSCGKTGIKIINGERKTCLRCRGNKKIDCPRCRGNGLCPRCKGSGEERCTKCGGTGFYQIYKGYTNIFKTEEFEFNYSDFEQLEKVLSKVKAEDEASFDDELIEWECIKKESKISQKKVVVEKIKKHSKIFFEKINEHIEEYEKREPNQRIGRIDAKIEIIPITKVNYKFEEQEYELFILGQGYRICYDEIPKDHFYKETTFKKFLEVFNKNKRDKAFTYIASYIFHADNSIDSGEIPLLNLFLNDKYKIDDNLNQSLTIEQIKPKIECLKGDLRALIFAWHCVLQDKKIKSKKKEAFDKLAKVFNIEDSEIEKIKRKSLKFAQLTDKQMIEEYLKSY